MRWMTSSFVALALASAPAVALAFPGESQDQNQDQDQDQAQNQDQGQGQYQNQQNQQGVQEDTFEWAEASGPRLGIMVTGLTSELRGFYGAPQDRGVLVARVAPQSSAARAGLHVGDILIAVKGQPIAEADDVLNVLSNLNRGETFPLVVIRDHKAVTLQAQLRRRHSQSNAQPNMQAT